jgi:hypothetical protein
VHCQRNSGEANVGWPDWCSLIAKSVIDPAITHTQVENNILKIVVRSSFLIDNREISLQIKIGTTVYPRRRGNAESTRGEGVAESADGGRENDNRRMFSIEEY